MSSIASISVRNKTGWLQPKFSCRTNVQLRTSITLRWASFPIGSASCSALTSAIIQARTCTCLTPANTSRTCLLRSLHCLCFTPLMTTTKHGGPTWALRCLPLHIRISGTSRWISACAGISKKTRKGFWGKSLCSRLAFTGTWYSQTLFWGIFGYSDSSDTEIHIARTTRSKEQRSS